MRYAFVSNNADVSEGFSYISIAILFIKIENIARYIDMPLHDRQNCPIFTE